MALDAFDSRRGTEREPETTITGEGLLGCEVVAVELGRVNVEATGR
jgi:hypothetical protein